MDHVRLLLSLNPVHCCVKGKKNVPKDCVLERKGKLIILGRNGIMFSEGQRSFIINGKNNRHMSRGQLSSGLSLRGKALGQKRSS